MRLQTSRKGKRTAIASCLLFACLCFLLLLQTVYAAGPPASVTLTVEQVFNTSAAGVKDVFPYELIAADPAGPMPSGSMNGVYLFTVSGTGSVNISMDFPDTGIYSYTLRPSPSAPAVSGYVYDNQVYQVTVTVSGQGDERLTAWVVVQKAGSGKSAALRFSHSYIYLPSDPGTMVDPPVRKTVSGNPVTNSVFTFKLSAGDSGNPMPAGSINGVKTMTIVGSGEKDFGTWAYTAEGTYYYTISEVNTHVSGYTYDTAVYTITDAVKAVNNQLTVSRTVTNRLNKPVTACIFINQYRKSSGGGGTNPGGTGTNPGGTNPEGTNPGETNPGITIPGVTNPGGTNPGGTPPGVTNPGDTPPEGANPGGTPSESTDPGDSDPGGNTEPGNSTKPDGKDSPKTGDDTSIPQYLAAMAASLAVAAGCIFGLIYFKKRERAEHADAN